MGCSRSGDTLTSLNGLESLMNSSNFIIIFSALKFRERLGGVSSSIVGGMESLGPPCGCWMMAHCQVREKRTAKRAKTSHFVFEAVFKRFAGVFILNVSGIGKIEKVSCG